MNIRAIIRTGTTIMTTSMATNTVTIANMRRMDMSTRRRKSIDMITATRTSMMRMLTGTITNTVILIATITHRASKIRLMPPSSISAVCRICAAN